MYNSFPEKKSVPELNDQPMYIQYPQNKIFLNSTNHVRSKVLTVV